LNDSTGSSTHTVTEWSAEMAKLPQLYQPGDMWSYGPQLSLLGAIIEAVDGRTLGNYLKDVIFTPLGMVDTGFFIQDADPRRAELLSRFHVLYDNGLSEVGAPPLIPVDYGSYHAGFAAALSWYGDFNYNGQRAFERIDAGLYSTIKDMAAFSRMIINLGKAPDGSCIISPATIYLLSENHIQDDTIDGLFENNSIGLSDMKWGLGVGVITGQRQDNTGSSSRSIGWGGAANTAGFMDIGNKSFCRLFTQVIGIVEPESSRSTDFTRLRVAYAAAVKNVCVIDETIAPNPQMKKGNYNQML
jgi:CubicO group peptidase (beta-lactamase class C family)